MNGIKADELSAKIMDELLNWCEEEEEIIADGIDKISLELVRELKNDPVIPERTGKYKKSFCILKNRRGMGFKKVIIGCKDPHYRLTHLLEKPHLTRNGTSRTKAYPHWGPAEQRLNEKYERLIKKI